jgi:ABC-type Fe3+/spermidine/putrescine transport system ATPase subunit
MSFSVRRGEQLALLGPSGCGKTATLRAIAGLDQPASGSIRIDGKFVYSRANGLDVLAEQRGISMVFQSYAIWPHMSVLDNVAYGLRVRRLDPAIVAEFLRYLRWGGETDTTPYAARMAVAAGVAATESVRSGSHPVEVA